MKKLFDTPLENYTFKTICLSWLHTKPTLQVIHYLSISFVLLSINQYLFQIKTISTLIAITWNIFTYKLIVFSNNIVSSIPVRNIL